MSRGESKKRSDRAPAPAATGGVLLARLLPGSTASALRIEIPERGIGPLAARTTVLLDPPTIERAVLTGQAVTVVFEEGDVSRPIVTGLLQPAPELDALQTLLLPQQPAAASSEARVDGKRVVLQARDEVVLKCGDASITLRKDGKVVVRGMYVETHSLGVNRIKGTTVKIN